MHPFLIWYLTGVLGMCVISYYDSKHGCVTRDDHLLMYLLVSVMGGIILIYALWILYIERKVKLTKN